MKIAFRMKLRKGHEQAYEERHNPVWEELSRLLKAQGVERYSIFLDPSSGDLFAYAEIEDPEKWRAIADTPICRKWWDHMAPLMEVNEDNSPVSTELKQVFDL